MDRDTGYHYKYRSLSYKYPDSSTHTTKLLQIILYISRLEQIRHHALSLDSFTPLLAPSAPTVLGSQCNVPREAGENKNCLGGSYNDCVARNNQLCNGECFGQPAGGAGAPCYTGCTNRNQQYCAGYCMKISNCDDCIKSLKEMGAAGSDEQHKETCSQEVNKRDSLRNIIFSDSSSVTSITILSCPAENSDEMVHWHSLPAEIRCMILETLTAHKGIALFASVSNEWRTFIEQRTFSHIRLHPASLDHLEQLNDHYRGQVKHLWLNIELNGYTCRVCRKRESLTLSYSIAVILREAITRLFCILTTWRESLTLELNVYCPSDSQYWFKNSYFGAPGEDKFECQEPSDNPIHDPGHGWVQDRVTEAPPDDALRRPFGLSELRFRESLPSVNAVTKFVLRRQCRQQFNPDALLYLWSKLPNLEEINYELWQSHLNVVQQVSDMDFVKTIQNVPENVRRVTIFEDFNENFLELYALGRGRLSNLNPGRVRLPFRVLGAAFAKRSQGFEHLSVSFMVDARHFFDACRPTWRWPRLKTLTLTHRAIAKANVQQTNKLLQTAAQVALDMPELQTLTIWHGERREACAFTYRRENGSICWQGTLDVRLELKTLEAWEKVAVTYAGRVLTVNSNLFMEDITSHGDAVHHLGLHHVVDRVSLQQIRIENRVSWI
ncbi:f-box domain-containing protein [Fusarium denticulatum]|uniref:F-box domain-containing protein n=1 Tax=Fusarium denticulatum TaxID=48507 RepID=A0A8H5X3J5_9HYPO|nr:f-box domain-containing protein [Fusarium denticulatum]